MRLQDARRDYYRKLAREQGYKSRAAFKLKEAVKKYRLIHEGDLVLDFGAAPGGWLQVASESARARGLVIGVDLSPISLRAEPGGAELIPVQSDVTSPELPARLDTMLVRKADVVLSDLSPNITGSWDLDHFRQVELSMTALSLMDRFIDDGGNAMFKVFDGERFGEMRAEFGKRFDVSHIMKPQASRRSSSELYLVGLGYLSTAHRRTASATS